MHMFPSNLLNIGWLLVMIFLLSGLIKSVVGSTIYLLINYKIIQFKGYLMILDFIIQWFHSIPFSQKARSCFALQRRSYLQCWKIHTPMVPSAVFPWKMLFFDTNPTQCVEFAVKTCYISHVKILPWKILKNGYSDSRFPQTFINYLKRKAISLIWKFLILQSGSAIFDLINTTPLKHIYLPSLSFLSR